MIASLQKIGLMPLQALRCLRLGDRRRLNVTHGLFPKTTALQTFILQVDKGLMSTASLRTVI